MILYLDTSILIKLYVIESDSQAVKEYLKEVDQIGTSWLAYPESRAALARRLSGQSGYARLLKEFEMDWPKFVRILPSEPLLRRSGDLVERHRLRGFDAVHLASALFLCESVSSSIIFWAADRALTRAAIKEGLNPP